MTPKRYVEFQAVVLAAGRGSHMSELTKDKPKCLLPVQNKPMIWYPLKLLEKTGFKEVTVIVPQAFKSEISSTVSEFSLKMKIDWAQVPDTVDSGEESGTADSLRYIYHKIISDLLVISCDLIMDIDLTDVLNMHRLHVASIVAVFFPLSKLPNNLNVPGPKRKVKVEEDLIGIDYTASNRLVLFANSCDLHEHLDIQEKVVRKHPKFKMHTNLLDAHCYVIKKRVIDYLICKKNINTIKGELISTIVKKQMTKRPPSKSLTTPSGKISYKNVYDQPDEEEVDTGIYDDIYHFIEEDMVDAWIMKNSVWRDHEYPNIPPYHGDIIRCYAVVHPKKQALRVNTLESYKYANYTELPVSFELDKISAKANIKGTQIQDSFIGNHATIEEKTSIMHSRIGTSSKVQSKTRVVDSIIMDNVTISQNCIIENCIIANNCFIEEGTRLKDCIVSSQYRTEKDNSYEREVLTIIKKMMEI